MAREIEIKVRVSDSSAFVRFLHKEAEFMGEQHQVDEYFTPPDRDFTAVRPVNEWLRLRTSEQRRGHLRSGSALGDHSSEVKETLQCSINYKLWHRDPVSGTSLYGDESESGVSDIKAVRDILIALKFRNLCTVDKIRKTWRIVIPDRLADGPSAKQDRESMPSGSSMSDSASGSDSRMTNTDNQVAYEIALDREKTLGDFVEVELIGETMKDVAIVRDEMLAFLHAHGITNPDADQVGYPYLLMFGDHQ